MTEPLDPELAALFGRASLPEPPEGAEVRVRARLESAIAVAGSARGGAGHGSLGARAWSLAGATFVAGAVVGGGVVAVLGARGGTSPAPRIETSAPGSVASAPVVEAPQEPADASVAPVASATVPRRDGAAERGGLTEERALLEQARQQLAAGDASSALGTLERHSRRFPHGVLSEEREALAVQALVNAGRYEEARRRGAELRRRVPNSVYLPAVDATLGSIP